MKLMAIDGNSIINRAFYGIRHLSAPDGTPTNAVYGFLNILQRLMSEELPDAICVAFDLPAPTFRHELYDGYKATRRSMPDELRVQLPLMKEILDAMNIYRCQVSGWEADDILGALSRRCEASGWECVIVTGDKDSLQLVDNSLTRVKLVRTQKGQTTTKDYTYDVFSEEYGFTPEKMIDLKALMGDSSDCIPGVRGVGEKTAMELVQRFGGIDEIYEQLETLDIKDSVRKKLADGRELAKMSFELALIRTDAPIPLQPHDAICCEYDNDRLFEIFQRLGFRSMAQKFRLTTPDAASQTVQMPENTEITGDMRETARKTGHDIKNLMRQRIERGDDIGDWDFDTALAAYLIAPGDSSYDRVRLFDQYIGFIPPADDEDIEIYAVCKLREALIEKMDGMGLLKLYEEVELPLCRVLAQMEIAGFLVDKDALVEYGHALSIKIDEMAQTIFALSGEEFNINSPKQLGEILFDKLMLPAPKKTKTGYSTNADVLDKLLGKHPVIGVIKDYRELSKLKSTYADGLLKVIAPDGRIHTHFQMTATATGRLSSTEPNLQNIPIRRESGEEFRKMFIAKDGHVLVDADYSQIELRILSHMADDPVMRRAFANDEDIHTVTASQVFGVAPEYVTATERSSAKAVNFGIVYGISAFSLAQDIGVSQKEAKMYIENYLAKYSGVREYMRSVVEQAKETGYVETIFGRRRYLPELKSSNFNIRAFGERVALNMPIQGTAADIMKIAMINVSRRLEPLQAGLILQVHDELIAECPESEAEEVGRILREEMENAANLSVPLVVEARAGKSWHSAK